MPTPSVVGATDYLGDTSWSAEDIQDAYDAEESAQRRRCKIPQDLTDPLNPIDDYPADLVEALYRRVAHNLALRNLPLGVQATLSESAVTTDRVGGLDAEVRRLEAPYRKKVLG